jgi:catechol 2,3-dioxygenase-like lactoylglutathione lyase family enzyme
MVRAVYFVRATSRRADVKDALDAAVLSFRFGSGARLAAAAIREAPSDRADPRRAKPTEINNLHGGRGVYFDDPNGHLMEIITQPYGDPPEQI